MKINKLILGTVQFGCQYGINSVGRPAEDVVKSILNEASAFGINTLDTSAAYGNAEELLGRIIPNKGHFKIVSKYPKCNVSPECKFDMTLNNLGEDKLFGYLLHHFDVYRANPKIWDDFVRLKLDERVERIGFSLYQPEELEHLLSNEVPFNLVQIPYNIFDRKFEPYLRRLHDMGVEIHVRSTFLQGLFYMDREKLPEKLLPLKKYLLQLDEYVQHYNTNISSVALNYNIQHPYIDGVLIGVDNAEQLRMNMHSIKDDKINLDINVIETELLNPVNWK